MTSKATNSGAGLRNAGPHMPSNAKASPRTLAPLDANPDHQGERLAPGQSTEGSHAGASAASKRRTENKGSNQGS